MKFTALGVAWIAWGCGSGNTAASDDAETEEEIVEQNLLYGIPADDYRIEHGEIAPGETMGRILNRYGVGAATVDRLDRAAKTDFPLDGIRAGNPYTVFIHEDSLNTPHLDYLVYERNASQYVVFGLHSVDSVSVTLGEKPVSVRRQKKQATIDSSLWGAIMREQMPYALAAELEEIYQWSIDFFGIQKGDAFTVVYDERIIDTTAVGIGRVWGAKFTHAGKDYYAIPFRQNNRIQYWDVSGGSLRKQLLKAPLKYSRISSRFSNARLHPIYKVYRPHHGVDYAAPKGTPVRAVADGVVTFKGWGGGGGNTLKIKHPGNMMSGYLHLSRFAKGIAQGSRVSQGQLIGYVGSTGASTGPHLDFRLWRNGKPIDPLKAPSEPAEPIAAQNRAAFEFVRDRIVAELDGEVSDSLRITQLDSIRIGQCAHGNSNLRRSTNGSHGSSDGITCRRWPRQTTERTTAPMRSTPTTRDATGWSSPPTSRPATRGRCSPSDGSPPRSCSKRGSWERYRVCSSAARSHAATRRTNGVICTGSPMRRWRN